MITLIKGNFEIVPQSAKPKKKTEIDLRGCDWNHLGVKGLLSSCQIRILCKMF